MTDITILGSSAVQTEKYETSAFIVTEGSKHVLIDCGPGIPRQLLITGINLLAISEIIITHSHGDHLAGLPYLLFLITQERRRQNASEKKIEIFAPSHVQDLIRQTIYIQYPDGFAGVDVSITGLDAHETYTRDSYSLTAVDARHPVPTVSIRLDFAGTSIAYSSDTTFSPSFVQLALNCTVMIHEAFGTTADKPAAERAKHAIASDAGDAARAAAAAQLLLLHILPKHRDDPNELIREAARFYDGPISVPDELQVIPITT